MLRVDIVKQSGELSIEASFRREGGVTGLFGAPRRQDLVINMIRGAFAADRRLIAVDVARCWRNLGGAFTFRLSPPIGYVLQDARCFRISM